MWRLANVLVLLFVLVPDGRSEEPRLRGLQPVKSWIGNLSHDLPRVRATAARALGETGSETAIEPLITCLSDQDADVRLYAAQALGRIDKRREDCLPALTKLLADGDEHVRYSAQWAISQFAHGFVRTEITLNDETGRVRAFFVAALK